MTIRDAIDMMALLEEWQKTLALCLLAGLVLAIYMINFGYSVDGQMSCLDGEIDSPEGMTVVTLPPLTQ